MLPLITLKRPQPSKAMSTRSMRPSAICFLRPAPIHALRLLRHSHNLYSPLRASSWLLMRSYLFSTLHDLRLVESLILLASFAATFQLTYHSSYTLLFLSSPKLPQRILVAYILYSLYAPHPISINPFKSVLFDTFTKERNAAVQLAGEGKTSDNEQLVWVLWKVLKGDGDHVSGGYSLQRRPVMVLV
jgi:hypothetical protein